MRGLFVLSRAPAAAAGGAAAPPPRRPPSRRPATASASPSPPPSLGRRTSSSRTPPPAAATTPVHILDVDNIKCYLRALDEKEELDAVFVNTLLSGVQQRNLEVAWAKPVLDRVGLIIEIFNAHAETKEAKLQSELAALMYMKTRLVHVRGPGGRLPFGASGEAEVVSARGRGSGRRGFMSVAGETELQIQRRRIQERRLSLLAQIEDVRRTREIQCSSRKRHGGSFGQRACNCRSRRIYKCCMWIYCNSSSINFILDIYVT